MKKINVKGRLIAMSYSKEEKKFYDYLRKKYFVSKKFRNDIKKAYEKENGKLDIKIALLNTSKILQNFITIGRRIWIDISYKVERDWIKIYQNNMNYLSGKFPKIEKKFSSIYDNYDSSILPQKQHQNFHKPLSKYFAHFCFSNKQFAKQLAGKTFEYHIQSLLEVCQYKFERQKEIRPSQILDFVYPSMQELNTSPTDCLVSECQSTLKDRFRLSLGKIPTDNPVKKYLFTASGLGIITESDKGDLSKEKINEIKDKGWNLVVFEDVKKKFYKYKSVISYEDFFNRVYPATASLWVGKNSV